MKNKNKATITAAPNIDDAKVRNPKDMTKILDYLRYKTACSLTISIETRIMRCCVCWYLKHLMELGAVREVGREFDKRTHRTVKTYSADKTKLERPQYLQNDLFKNTEVAHGLLS